MKRQLKGEFAMKQQNAKLKNPLCAMILASALCLCCAGHAHAAYSSPHAATAALAAAVKSGDKDKMEAVLGGDAAKDIISSGDAVADENARDLFLTAYNTRHHIVEAKDGQSATLNIGYGNWPFPVRLVRGADGWSFDAVGGAQEILYRRVGRNEMDAIEVELAVVDAQKDYSDMTRRENGTAVYAQKIVSSEGKKDGLYWPTKEGEPQSPLGDLIAQASAEGYGGGGGKAPYHGYYYKLLTKQGPSAHGGALDYIVDGKMIGGFALIAWPAKYGDSGVMTFMVNHEGAVFQKDLGKDTDAAVAKIDAYDPDSSWRPARENESAKEAGL
jgi:hypothetical protein